jgi:hypothetical protein
MSPPPPALREKAPSPPALKEKAPPPPALKEKAPQQPAPKERPLEEKGVSLQNLARVSAEQRLAMIREAAYFKAEARNFAPGNDDQDWADAEREIDELLAKARSLSGS